MWPYAKKTPYYPHPLGGAVVPGSLRATSSGIPPDNIMLFGNGAASNQPIESTAVETAFDFSAPIPAGFMAFDGAILWFNTFGRYSDTGTPTLTLRARLDNGTTGDIVTQVTPTLGTDVTSNPWHIHGGFHVRSVSGGLIIREYAYCYVNNTPTMFIDTSSAAVVAVNLNVAHTLFISALWGTASALNTITMHGFQVYSLRPLATA